MTDGRLQTFSAPFRYVWPSELDLMAPPRALTFRERWNDVGTVHRSTRAPAANTSRSGRSPRHHTGPSRGRRDGGPQPAVDAARRSDVHPALDPPVPTRPDPLDDIQLILEAAVKAPNGGNQQAARFLVVDDRDDIREFGALYREAWWAKRHDEGFERSEDLPRALPAPRPAWPTR